MAEHRDLDELFVDIAGQIRAKKGTSNPIKADDLPYEVSRIISEGGVDTSDATAAEDEIAFGKTAYLSDGGIHMGTQPVRDEASITITEDASGNMQASVPKGLYRYDTTTSLPTAIVHKPYASVVKETGKAIVTPEVTMTKGFQNGGTTIGYPTEILASDIVSGSINIVPTASASSVDVTNYANANIAGDVNLIPSNVKKNVTIFGTTGTLETQGIDPSDATATADDILLNKTAYIADGSKAVGTQPEKFESDITITPTASGLTAIVPNGLYKSSVTKTFANGNLYGPTISATRIGNTMSIRAPMSNTSGYLNATSKWSTYTVSASQLVSGIYDIMPSKSASTYDITNYYAVHISGDNNLIPGNIAKDVSIFGVVGTLDSGGVHTSDATASAADILFNKTAYISDGTKAFGTIPILSGSTYIPTTSKQEISAKTYLSGTISIAGDINLIPSNIAKDISIFGVVGTHEAFEPSGTIEISTNGVYNVRDYSRATVSVSGGGSDGDLVAWLERKDVSAFNRAAGSAITFSPFTLCYDTNITSIYAPNCTYIQAQAFQSARALSLATFPACQTIYASAFAGITTLKTVDIPNCTYVDSSAFYDSPITSINMPNLQFVGSSAFAYTSITNLNLSFCTNAGICAFSNMRSLKTVNLPQLPSVTSSMFAYCWSLETVNMPKCTQLYSSAFYYCSLLTEIKTSIITYMGNNALNNCRNLKTIILDEYTECTVGLWTFYSCYSLEYAYLPRILALPSQNFAHCYNLSFVYLEDCSRFSYYTFDQCSSLKEVAILTGYVETTSSSIFRGCTNLQSIYVPSHMLDYFKTRTGWSYFSDKIVAVPSSICGNKVFRSQYCANQSITTFIDSTVTAINYQAFSNCRALTTISCENVNFVGNYAFANCSHLANISLPNCSILGRGAFSSCRNGLQTISLPNVLYIQSSAFFGNPKLNTVSLGSNYFCSLENATVFGACPALTSIYIPTSLSSQYYQDGKWAQYSNKFVLY